LPVPPSADVAGPADVQAVDPQNVFVALRLEPNGQALSRGLLLHSADGGATWKSRLLPEGGDISFTSAEDGWLVGGFDREALYATHNAGQTWKQVKAAVSVKGAFGAAYDPPVFSDGANGVLPVSLPAGKRSSLAFATTVNGGGRWSRRAVVRVPALDLGKTVPSAVADPDTWLADSAGKLVSITGGGTTRTTVGPLPSGTSGLQFSSSQLGWATAGGCGHTSCSVALFGTQDGGLTWNRIQLPTAK
jgi:photosystem II stability/assembly factor-like uncharacterized protein